MATARLSEMVARLGRRLPPQHPEADAELLGRFLATRDEAAFAEVVRRHGPLVFGVCRRVTGHHHLAEDAFQAVFVVLAAKAGAVRPRSALPGWLYGVAYRTAVRARTMSDRRRKREAVLASSRREPAGGPDDPAERDDLVAILDEEVGRLPGALRSAVVLCELQGKSRRDAAAALGVPEGTVSSRLAAARKALAVRLRARGVALTAAGLSAGLGQATAVAVPGELVARAVAVAVSPGVVPAAVAALSNGVLRMMLVTKLKAVPVVLVLLAGGLVLAENPGVDTPGSPKTDTPKAEPPKTVAAKPADPKPLPPKGPNKILVYKSGHLVLIDPDGKNEQRVSENRAEFMPGTMSKLSPDGKAYATVIQIDKPGETPAGQSPRRRLYVRKLDELQPGTDTGVQCQMFCWSPDGTKLATSEFIDGLDRLPDSAHYLVDAKTGEKTALKLPANHIVTGWLADGDRLLTSSIGGTPDAPTARLYLMNLDGTEHKALTDGKTPTLFGAASPDGKRLLTYQLETKEETPAEKKVRDEKGAAPPRPTPVLVLMDVATGKATPVEGLPLNASDGVMACWSPDGKRIAYVWREKHEGDPKDLGMKETESFLVVSDPDGRNAKTILSEKGQGQWVITLGIPDWR